MPGKQYQAYQVLLTQQTGLGTVSLSGELQSMQQKPQSQLSIPLPFIHTVSRPFAIPAL
jgi:hypothetical protein